ncbi:MAG: UDP-N-acetylmuramoyl-L-alanyl-D-glutamate--2,6-diaminopimelate ligase [Actinobacteria bacterium]|nr:UDP-N-acetylmuramoyl-L-alanyl-D-glutamate--2,6-diaminopimelate ligase [Thermoleophilia bacterium]MCB9012227.1 UDP-N-acetylmuramoyl-L-alanyl-D-glutamate--2,6-diaminopimelate ligase [Actinomycetota bacterium]
MRLAELVAAVPGARVVRPGPTAPSDPLAIEVTHVAPRADLAEPGAIFVCVRGVRVDGHDLAGEAVGRGAGVLVVERPLDLDVAQVLVPDARSAVAMIASELVGRPADRLTVVGVTGTNGKTTSAYILRAVLEASGRQCGLMGTVESIVGGTAEPTTHTTLDPVALHRVFARMVAAGDRACAMEVSSHALAQHRVAGVPFAAAVFTNLSRDHLDYHADLEDYFAAKLRLFVRDADEGDDPPAAVNMDDPYGRRIAEARDVLGYAMVNGADVRPSAYRQHATGLWARVDTPRGPLEIESRLRGRFNLANILGAVGVGELLDLSHHDVAAGIASLSGVAGRMEAIDAGQPFQVLVDYAHTPDSLRNVLVAARELAGDHRVGVVFGCGGDRDRGKRPQMGAVAAELADIATVTSDNPRSEDPEQIIREIVAGMDGGRAERRIEPDRRTAIGDTMALMRAGDVLIIAGKGHERGQDVGGVVHPFDDRAVARELLGARQCA